MNPAAVILSVMMKARYTVIGFTDACQKAAFHNRVLQFVHAATADDTAGVAGEQRVEIWLLDRPSGPSRFDTEFGQYSSLYFLNGGALEYARSVGAPLNVVKVVEADDADTAEFGILFASVRRVGSVGGSQDTSRPSPL